MKINVTDLPTFSQPVIGNVYAINGGYGRKAGHAMGRTSLTTIGCLAIMADRLARPSSEERATIERCAKVADAHREKWLAGMDRIPGLAAAALGAGDIAKAIRALPHTTPATTPGDGEK